MENEKEIRESEDINRLAKLIDKLNKKIEKTIKEVKAIILPEEIDYDLINSTMDQKIQLTIKSISKKINDTIKKLDDKLNDSIKMLNSEAKKDFNALIKRIEALEKEPEGFAVNALEKEPEIIIPVPEKAKVYPKINDEGKLFVKVNRTTGKPIYQ